MEEVNKELIEKFHPTTILEIKEEGQNRELVEEYLTRFWNNR